MAFDPSKPPVGAIGWFESYGPYFPFWVRTRHRSGNGWDGTSLSGEPYRAVEGSWKWHPLPQANAPQIAYFVRAVIPDAQQDQFRELLDSLQNPGTTLHELNTLAGALGLCVRLEIAPE